MRGAAFPTVLAALLVPQIARAAEPALWRGEVGAHVGLTVLGEHGDTGGVTPEVSGRVVRTMNTWLELRGGAQLAAFGFEANAMWIGVLGGVHAGAAVRLDAFRLGLNGTFDGGRVPVCNAWGLCLPYIGVYPGGRAELSWAPWEQFYFSAEVTVRYVKTLPWEGAGVFGGAGGRFAF